MNLFSRKSKKENKKYTIKRGDRCYFDQLGLTNRSDIITVTVIKKISKSKYICVTDSTCEVIRVNKKYLIPIDNSDVPVFMINKPTNSFSFKNEDTMLIRNIIEIYTNLYNCIVENKEDKDEAIKTSLDPKNIESVITGLRIIENKLSLHLACNGEIETINTIERIDTETNSEFVDAIKMKYSVDEEEKENIRNNKNDPYRDPTMEFANKMKTDISDPYDVDAVTDFISKYFPKETILNNPFINKRLKKGIFTTHEDIENLSSAIYSSLESTNDGIIYIPYIDVYTSNIKCVYFRKDISTYDDIYNELLEIFTENNIGDNITFEDAKKILNDKKLNHDEFSEGFILPSIIVFMGMDKPID